MNRSFHKVRPSVHRVYSVKEVLKLYSICRNTLSNWVKDGLAPSDARRPQVFQGSELKRFHGENRKRKSTRLAQGEFKCLSCKYPVFPRKEDLEQVRLSSGPVLGKAICPDCRGPISKLLSATECNRLDDNTNPTTQLDSKDESIGEPQRCLGTIERMHHTNIHLLNDRVIHVWQQYAGRYDPKTVAQHLQAIRDFEDFLAGACFKKLTPMTVSDYRKDLMAKLETGKLMTSTVTHRASFVRSFLTWLGTQPGYKSLDATLSDYLDLPKSVLARSKRTKDKSFPDQEHALQMVAAMPDKTIVDRRDRAMVACAFLTGLRASALITLPIDCVDLAKRTVLQDGRRMKAKNGKTYQICFFPEWEACEVIFTEWIKELNRLGASPTGPVFPKQDDLLMPDLLGGEVRFMRTPKALCRAFSRASKAIGQSYSPHRARDTLASQGAKICHTMQAHKAWSMNLGHDDIRTTEQYYGAPTDTERQAVIESLNGPQGAATHQDERDLMLDYHQHLLTRGTPEFERAERLIEERLRSR